MADGTGADTFKQAYTYDRWGNRTIDQVNTTVNVPHPEFAIDTTKNQLTAPAGYPGGNLSYDLAGNQRIDTYTTGYPDGDRTFDAENRMIAAQFPGEKEEATWAYYTYNGDGQRVRRNVSGYEIWQVYGFDGELLAEYPQTGPSMALAQPQKEYGYRNGQMLVTTETFTNLAWNKPATQTDNHAPTTTANKAVNGDVDGALWNGSASATNYHQNSWWQVDLQSVQTIDNITVWGRTDCCPEMTSNFRVFVSDNPFTSYDFNATIAQPGVSNYPYSGFAGPASINVNRTGRYVRVQLAGTQYLVLGEVQVWSQAAKINWMVTDHLGTPRMVADKTGATVGISRHDYLPFGEELFAGTGGRTTGQGYTSSDGVRQQFTQKERDNETGLDYFGARYFASIQGRFTGIDSMGPNLANPQTLNKYQYCLNNPLAYVDRNGDYEEDVHRDLTYALALAAGFNDFAATMIAGANQHVDDNPATSPMGMTPWGENVTKRELHHFTTPARRDELWEKFTNSGSLQDLGVFFHAEQDSFSHKGYSARFGHIVDRHDPDKTYNDGTKPDDGKKANRMAYDTFSLMIQALDVLKSKGTSAPYYDPVDWSSIAPMVREFNRARNRRDKKAIIQKIVAEVMRQHAQQFYKRVEEDYMRELAGDKRRNPKRR